MKNVLRNPFKMTISSLIGTIFVSLLLVFTLSLATYDSQFVHWFGKITIAISLPLLMLLPAVGFIYAFFVKGKLKILFLLLHIACICTISLFALMSFLFRYFFEFAP